MIIENDLVLRARWWTYHKQQLGNTAKSIDEVLHNLFGVYSSHPSAPLTLWARTHTFSETAFQEIEKNRKAIRIPAMRGSIFLVGRKDAATIFSLVRMLPEQMANRLAIAGVTVEEFKELKTKMLAVATEPMTPEQLRKVTGENEARITTIARVIAMEGEMLRIGAPGLRSNILRYVNTASWYGSLLEQHNPDEALSTLAERYLNAFGPARVKDFQWWVGTTKTKAAAALQTLDTVTLADGSLLLTKDLAAYEQIKPLPEDIIDILPKWDSYTMGYAQDGRARFVAPEMLDRVYTNVGDGLGVVLLAGKAVSTWTSKFVGKRCEITLDIFDPSAQPHIKKIEQKFAEIATLLGGTTCTITASTTELAPSLGLSRLRKTKVNETTFVADS